MQRRDSGDSLRDPWRKVKQGRLDPLELQRLYEAMGMEEMICEDEPPVHSLTPVVFTLRAMVEDMSSGGRALDLGCGSNPHASFLMEETGLRVVATEFAASYASLARRLARKRGSSVDFVICDGRFLPFRQGSFATVLVSEVLEHIPDDRAVVEEVRCCLEERGRVFVTVPNRNALPLWIRRLKNRINGRNHPDEFYFNQSHSDLRRYDGSALDHIFQRFVPTRRYRVVPFAGSIMGGILGLAMHLPGLRGLGLSLAASYEKMAP